MKDRIKKDIEKYKKENDKIKELAKKDIDKFKKDIGSNEDNKKGM
ncbi:hypothetical protein [Flavobacterium profundi]|nr:hypothetical protein [Flavobacterium profundi]